MNLLSDEDIAKIAKALKDAEEKAKKERYPMCDPQPAQIDCRVEDCTYYMDAGKCSNVAPAITLNPRNTFVCWSKKEKEKWVCPVKDNPCPYNYDACNDKTKYCRILEDTPEHFEQMEKQKHE